MHQVLKDDLGRKPFKMMHRHELTDGHVAMRAQKCRKILKDIDEDTLPNLVFTDEKKFDIQQVVNQQNDRVWASSSATEERIVTRRQNPQSVMVFVRAAFCPGDPPPFCLIWSQIELPAVHRGYFGGLPATLGQSAFPRRTMDLATGFYTLSWLQVHTIPSFISKEDWPARNPDLNPLDYSILSILENKVCSTPHPTVEALKAKLLEWDAIPQETLRAACASFTARSKAVVKNKGRYIE